MKNAFFLFLAVLASIVLAACKPTVQPAPEAAAPDTSESSPILEVVPVEENAHSGDSMLWADALQTCEKNQIARIFWSKDAIAGGAARIELGDGENPSVFARIGKPGEKETGPWAGPGTTFVLRGDIDGIERSRLILPAPQGCN